MMGEGQLLVLQSLGCVRGGRTLFSGLNLALCAGEAAIVTGANGAGKTSLLRVIAGLLKPSAGSVNAGGRIGFAGEKDALDPEQTLGAALNFWAKIDGGDIAVGLYAMDMEHLAQATVHILSTGQRKRAAIAGVIASNALIWLLDEPANGLDSTSVMRLEMAIAAHQAKGGIIVAATHQPIKIDNVQQINLA
jgi:heme exporter protein A